MSHRRFLVLGCGDGWHAEQLRAAAAERECELLFAGYESLAATIRSRPDFVLSRRPVERSSSPQVDLASEAGSLETFDGILTRTMPSGSLEQITFRLAVLHDYLHLGLPIVNRPRALEIAIDKFATLAEVARMGFPVPATEVVQSRQEAMRAFHRLGADCVVKPIFGGEGRGVMRLRDPELAWTTFSTLQQLGAVFYVQQFVPPGGRDTRVLVIGDRLFGVRRSNDLDFRTNVRGGGKAEAIEPSESQATAARQVTCKLGLTFAAVDFLEGDDGIERIVEINAVPGWKGAQQVLPESIAGCVIDLLLRESGAIPGACRHVG